MAFAPRDTIITWVSIALLTGQISCATAPYTLPPPPSEQVRTQLGTIGVVSARFAPGMDFRMPVKGPASGAGRGAAQAMGGVLGSGGELGVIALPLAAVVGAIGGAAAAVMEPIEGLEEAETALKAAVAELNIQQEMRERFLQVAREQTCLPLVLMEQGPSAVDEEVAHRSLATEGIHTVLEISVLRLDLLGKWWEKDPLVALVMAVRTRLMNVPDGKKLYESSFEYRSGIFHFTEWGGDDAQLFRREVNRAYQRLAQDIVDVLFLSPPREPKTEVEESNGFPAGAEEEVTK